VLRRWAGPLVTLLIVGGVALIVALNLNLNLTPARPSSSATSGPTTTPRESAPPAPASPGIKPAGFREYPIGDEVLKDHMRIAAVWLPPIAMDGMPAMSAGGDVIHLEADIHATEGNPNGFAKDEFVPYLKIHYAITPAGGGAAIHEGELLPMVARDGLHYGASLEMPKAGAYRLTYRVEPPSAGGLGRHSDPVTGVAPWWQPFEVVYDWDYPGPPRSR
jgi:periplasmic iron binding protein